MGCCGEPQALHLPTLLWWVGADRGHKPVPQAPSTKAWHTSPTSGHTAVTRGRVTAPQGVGRSRRPCTARQEGGSPPRPCVRPHRHHGTVSMGWPWVEDIPHIPREVAGSPCTARPPHSFLEPFLPAPCRPPLILLLSPFCGNLKRPVWLCLLWQPLTPCLALLAVAALSALLGPACCLRAGEQGVGVLPGAFRQSGADEAAALAAHDAVRRGSGDGGEAVAVLVQGNRDQFTLCPGLKATSVSCSTYVLHLPLVHA